MTDPSPRPKRRWLWISVGLLFVVSFVGWLWTAGSDRFAENFDWLVMARQRNLTVNYWARCPIPGLENSEIGKKILCRRQVWVGVSDLVDVENLLTMPACPMNVEIALGFNSQAARDRLTERFGKQAIK